MVYSFIVVGGECKKNEDTYISTHIKHINCS